ncbi:MAG: LysR substrate-binding domain-containing protein [Pseudomonadota bacterium]
MARKTYNLPPLGALDAFEVAARHRSFKRGASELNVSPSAVSHQIKALETELGLPLFDRNRRGVELNRDGAALFAALEHGFSHIGAAVEALRQRSTTRGVRVIATTAMSHLWLTPRLGRFWREHGTVTVNQEVSDLPWGGEPYDLLIRYADLNAEDGDCDLLFNDRLRPLASPDFARENAVSDLATLAHLPLIHLNAPDRQWTSWAEWLAALGHDIALPDGLTVNNYVIALQAAEDGMGVVLGWERMTAPLVDKGVLVPFTDFSIPAPRSFYVRKSPNALGAAALLRDWLVAEAQRET